MVLQLDLTPNGSLGKRGYLTPGPAEFLLNSELVTVDSGTEGQPVMESYIPFALYAN